MNTNIFVKCLKNNIIISITNKNKTIKTISAGHIGIKGAKRGTRHSTQEILKIVQTFLLSKKLYYISIYIEGFGKGRAIILKNLKHPALKFIKFIELSKLKHNGCRLKKKRRI